jgi:hypothetical protein
VDLLRLPLITRIAPDFLLLAVRQIGQHVLVMHRGRRRADRGHHAFLAIDANVRLGAEVILVAPSWSDASRDRVPSCCSWSTTEPR